MSCEFGLNKLNEKQTDPMAEETGFGSAECDFRKLLRLLTSVAVKIQSFCSSLIKALCTFPTYCGSEPMYSSSTKNWFHTQPLLTLWNPLEPPFLPAADGPVWLWGHSCPGLLWKGAQELCSKRKHRNSSRQFLLSIGRTVLVLFPRQGPEEKR